jgi:hypothetical protein
MNARLCLDALDWKEVFNRIRGELSVAEIYAKGIIIAFICVDV